MKSRQCQSICGKFKVLRACLSSPLCYNEDSVTHWEGLVRRSRNRRTSIVLVIISLLVIISMALSMAEILAPPRRVVPTITPILAPFPTETPTPPPA